MSSSSLFGGCCGGRGSAAETSAESKSTAPGDDVIKATSLTMNDGNAHPAIGYGTYKVGVVPSSSTAAVAAAAAGQGKQQDSREEDAEEIVGAALRTGYRAFDCAQYYENEDAVGRALKSSGVPREGACFSSCVLCMIALCVPVCVCELCELSVL